MTKDALLECHERIKPFIHRTEVLSSSLINEVVGAQIYFKCENFQRGGAYKMRGATNAILQLSSAQRKKGVVTHSSGNFAQAVSLGAKSLAVTAHIVMPTSAPEVKKAGVKQYQGVIYECKPTLKAREQTANEIADKTGACLLYTSPSPRDRQKSRMPSSA